MTTLLRGARHIIANLGRTFRRGRPTGGESHPYISPAIDIFSARDQLREAETLREFERERLRKEEERGRDPAP